MWFVKRICLLIQLNRGVGGGGEGESSTGHVFIFDKFCADTVISIKACDAMMHPMQPLLNRGYHLHVGNYYCCPQFPRVPSSIAVQLLESLKAAGTMICGTVTVNQNPVFQVSCKCLATKSGDFATLCEWWKTEVKILGHLFHANWQYMQCNKKWTSTPFLGKVTGDPLSHC